MFSCSQSWLWQKNFFTCYHVPVTKNNDNFCLGSCPFCHLPGPRSRWKNLANQHDYFLWFLASGGGLPVFPKIYSIAQWSCSTSLSLWKIPDSNPGPLQSGALPISHHIFEEQKWCMFLVALSQMFDCRKPLDDLHDDTHEMGRLQILSTQVQIYQGRRLMEASLNCWTYSHIIISSKW